MIKKVEITMADPCPFVNFICFNSASEMYNTFIMWSKRIFGTIIDTVDSKDKLRLIKTI